jgi:putative Holliday junction resolvase
MSRILSIDYGEKRIGMAVSDESAVLASGLGSIENKGESFVISEIKKICGENKVGKIVVGRPLGLSGQKTNQTEKVEKFANTLERKVKLPIELVDERFTSVLAKKYILEKGRKRSKEKVDTLSAKILLQDYLDRAK